MWPAAQRDQTESPSGATFNRIDFDQNDRYLPQPRVPSEEIAGLVERVTFFNPGRGFAVLRVHVRGQRDPVTELARSIGKVSLRGINVQPANVAQEPFGDESPLGDGSVS